jgi:hypothetical protein
MLKATAKKKPVKPPPVENPPIQVPKITEYIVIGGRWHDVERTVNEMLIDGWEPFGGVTFVEYEVNSNDAYCGQAMVRRA